MEEEEREKNLRSQGKATKPGAAPLPPSPPVIRFWANQGADDSAVDGRPRKLFFSVFSVNLCCC